MEHLTEEKGLSPDWAIHATRTLGLSSASPVAWYGAETHPSGSMRVDIHQGLEVGVILSGEQARRFEDVTIRLRPGDVWLCAMWEPHEWRVLSEGSSMGIVFLPEFLGEESFEGVSWLSLFALPPAQRPRVTSTKMRKRMLEIAEDLRSEFAEKRRGWKTAVRLRVLYILSELLREWDLSLTITTRQTLYASDLTRIMPALDLLQKDPARQIRLSEVAEACRLSPSRFARIFLKTMGMSFSRFRLRARLAFVARRLLTSQVPVGALASETGFVDDSHLIHTFVKHYGCTPGQYRRQALLTNLPKV